MTDSNARGHANSDEPEKMVMPGGNRCPGLGCDATLDEGTDRCHVCDQAVFWQPKVKTFFYLGKKTLLLCVKRRDKIRNSIRYI